MCVCNAGVVTPSASEGAPEVGDTEGDTETEVIAESQGETEEEEPLQPLIKKFKNTSSSRKDTRGEAEPLPTQEGNHG